MKPSTAMPTGVRRHVLRADEGRLGTVVLILAHRVEKPVQSPVISTVPVPASTVTLEIPFCDSSTIQIISPGRMLLEVELLELMFE